jgi:LPS sulfotransferase NodH
MIDYLIISQKRSGTNILFSYLRSKFTIKWINTCKNIDNNQKLIIKPGLRKIGVIIIADYLQNKQIYSELFNKCSNKTKVVVNTRDNLLLTFASLKIAEKTQKWAFLRSKIKISFNINEYNAFKRNYYNQQLLIRKFLQKKQLSHLKITYEQFLKDKKSLINRVFNFLTVKPPIFIFNTYFLPKQEHRAIKDIFI